MSDSAAMIPILPRPLAAGLGMLPLAPLGYPLSTLMRRVIARNPGLIERLGPYRACRFAIDPTDLPCTLLLHPDPVRAHVSVHSRPPEAEVRIAGPLAALIGLVHGAYDGDALFFSRDLVIEGDTSAALALRNAIDDAELDLAAELALLAGPLGRMLDPLIDMVARASGVSLRRVEQNG
ncbi:ubiquinone anaerobic biosynthesis accessory factor UbiT [Alkalilacustris brevis]|uniref:ubiquinone anaerobic biosynthesis accessory factor UbiT n=1 Tax=Alkalilacustris brevis TaxID=2026338 RepID=UPI000E0CF847|nr:SCP2 sterol-binding domain-containing protein [Alkalilacustris brevis]